MVLCHERRGALYVVQVAVGNIKLCDGVWDILFSVVVNNMVRRSRTHARMRSISHTCTPMSHARAHDVHACPPALMLMSGVIRRRCEARTAPLC